MKFCDIQLTTSQIYLHEWSWFILLKKSTKMRIFIYKCLMYKDRKAINTTALSYLKNFKKITKNTEIIWLISKWE